MIGYAQISFAITHRNACVEGLNNLEIIFFLYFSAVFLNFCELTWWNGLDILQNIISLNLLRIRYSFKKCINICYFIRSIIA